MCVNWPDLAARKRITVWLLLAFLLSSIPHVISSNPATSFDMEVTQYLQRTPPRYSCTSSVQTKQSCLFHNVCLVFGGLGGKASITAVQLAGSHETRDLGMEQLGRQLRNLLGSAVDVFPSSAAAAANSVPTNNHTIASTVLALWEGNVINENLQPYGNVTVLARDAHKAAKDSTGAVVLMEDALTVMTVPGVNQYSLGHALGNTALPLYLMLLNHLREEELPTNIQLLFSTPKWSHMVLLNVVRSTLTHNVHLLPRWLSRYREQQLSGVCFRNLLLGDGGYLQTSKDALGGQNEAQHFSARPTFFSSHSWASFKRHAFKVSGILPVAPGLQKPLVVLNDKHMVSNGQVVGDKRTILDIGPLSDQIKAAYPGADVLVVRFRDFSLVDQMRIMAAATVYITTAGSDSHLAIFMPFGSTVVLLGGPEDEATQQKPWLAYTSFNELDRWFPLSYVHFERYVTYINDTSSYVVRPDTSLVTAGWQPEDPKERARWWNYNADIRVNMTRLKPMLTRALGAGPSA